MENEERIKELEAEVRALRIELWKLGVDPASVRREREHPHPREKVLYDCGSGV